MLSLIGFLLVIGILVVVHEYGHYFFARLLFFKRQMDIPSLLP
jgi:membrane-associated protease RseP (regulator of RpoE activity)